MSDVAAPPPAPRAARAAGPGVWEDLAGALSPAHLRPVPRPGVEIARVPGRTGDHAIIRAPGGAAHLRLEPWEADLVHQMDGRASLADLTAGALRSDGALRPGDVAALVEALRVDGFLAADPTDVWDVVARRLDPTPTWRRRLRRLVRELSVEWTGADALVRAAYGRGLKAAFHPAGVAAGAVLAVAGLLAFTWLVAPGRYHLTPAHPGIEFAVIWGLNVVVIFFHELAHALVLTHHGRVVRSAGFRLYFGSPAFFVDSADALMLPRRSRIAQAFAGSYAEMLLAAPAAIALVIWPEMWGADTLYKWVVLNYFLMLMNLVPMLELDGYWMLADWLRIPDLRQRSLAFLRRDLWQKLRRRQRLTSLDAGLVVFGVFGIVTTILALALSFFFWEHLFLPVIQRMWGGGTSGRILLVLLVVVVAGPAVRGLARLARGQVRRARDALWRLRFRLQRRWRVDAARTLDTSGAFGDIPVEVLDDVAGRVRLRTVRAGDAVVRQGDPPDAYYLVREGTLDVIEEHPGGTERTIRTLAAGDGFGELGLLDGSLRTATVRAASRAVLYEVGASTFQRLLAARAAPRAYTTTLQQAATLRSHPTFRHLGVDAARDVAAAGEFVRVAPGDVVVRQGDPADAFYAVFAGRAEVLEDGERRRELTRGDHFGEIALLHGGTRTATVRALTPLRVFRVEPDAFHRLLTDALREAAPQRAAGGRPLRAH